MTGFYGFLIGLVFGGLGGCIFMTLFWRRNKDSQAAVEAQIDKASSAVIQGSEK